MPHCQIEEKEKSERLAVFMCPSAGRDKSAYLDVVVVGALLVANLVGTVANDVAELWDVHEAAVGRFH